MMNGEYMHYSLSSLSCYLFLSSIATAVPAAAGEVTAGLPVNTIEASASGSLSIDTAGLAISLSPKGSYDTVKKSILSRKAYIRHSFAVSTAGVDTLYNLAKTTMEHCIVNELLPFWYGTPWDFNGYTKTPRRGAIACGYFVSTVLQHCGFSLNRYTLAQQNPYLEAVSLQLGDSVQEYHCVCKEFVSQFRQRNEDGLYFVGLDFHVGFLLLRAGELLFLHSAYYDPLCVTIEKAADSPVAFFRLSTVAPAAPFLTTA